MVDVPPDALKDALNADPEFRHAARYWHATVRLGIGDAPLVVRIADGRVADVRPPVDGDAADVAIDAPASAWAELLAPVPRPFYQSLYAATLHHDVSLSGDPLDVFAYLGALTRLVDVARGAAAR